MAFVQSEIPKGAEGTTANPSVSYSSTPTDGDLLVIVFQANSPVATTITLPSGYTSRVALDVTGGCLVIADRVAATTGKPQTITWANGTSAAWSMAIYRFTGQAATGYFDQAGSVDGGTATSVQPGSLTPVNPGELFIAAARQGSTNGGSEAIDSSFVIELASTFARMVVGSKIKGAADAAAENPTLSWATSRACAAGMVCYSQTDVSAGAAGQPTARRWEHVPHVRLGRGGPVRLGG